ncbi:hypothetical protein TSACC_23149 [Terrimicrobium sacchariphilum]|uniref:Uncharacterized protein n=1 Tax=Terrimicrobium sacchariphilum TaxID=690879 RepID=A0A146GDZ5_TERSA|nr:hypothetical protein [Terrimicrobium sacchariphilum]GAT34716.1 hypothetical protein TSACC_23149 [Terrimicrobium sacchariphilum]
MRPFYLLAAVVIVTVAWLIYTKFLAADEAAQSPPVPSLNAAAPQPHGLTPEQVRNRKEILKTYQRQLRESTSVKDKKALQDKINALQKEIAGS